jgi:hypothetical protein
MAPSQKIAYIEGSGDDVPAALEALGGHVSFLSAQNLASGELSKYDTIVVGVRAYAVRRDLIANNGRLLKYVEDGGVVIVQYNTPSGDARLDSRSAAVSVRRNGMGRIGSAPPRSGGPCHYLLQAFGTKSWGRLISFYFFGRRCSLAPYRLRLVQLALGNTQIFLHLTSDIGNWLLSQ